MAAVGTVISANKKLVSNSPVFIFIEKDIL
jgi:hypothetical protein